MRLWSSYRILVSLFFVFYESMDFIYYRVFKPKMQMLCAATHVAKAQGENTDRSGECGSECERQTLNK